MSATKPLESAIAHARDEVLWWEAAITCCGPGQDFSRPLADARQRYRTLCRLAACPERVSGRIPQDTIDRIMDLVTMPDIIPDLLSRLCGETLEWRPGAREAHLATCPFCGNNRRNFDMVLSGPKCGLWICRACDEGGNLLLFLMRRAGLGFRELMERLGQYAGVSLPAPVQPRQERWEPV